MFIVAESGTGVKRGRRRVQAQRITGFQQQPTFQLQLVFGRPRVGHIARHGIDVTQQGLNTDTHGVKTEGTDYSQ